jgi:hypothetical protein
MQKSKNNNLVLFCVNAFEGDVEFIKKWIKENGYDSDTVIIRRTSYDCGDSVLSVVYKLPWEAPLKYLFMWQCDNKRLVKWQLKKPIF